MYTLFYIPPRLPLLPAPSPPPPCLRWPTLPRSQIAFKSGVVAARKRQFTLACCKGTAILAVACVQIGPKNDSVRSFLAQDACMSLRLLTVDPASPKFKAGAHLCKEVRHEAVIAGVRLCRLLGSAGFITFSVCWMEWGTS